LDSAPAGIEENAPPSQIGTLFRPIPRFATSPIPPVTCRIPYGPMFPSVLALAPLYCQLPKMDVLDWVRVFRFEK
jgi:hypothetical protein